MLSQHQRHLTRPRLFVGIRFVALSLIGKGDEVPSHPAMPSDADAFASAECARPAHTTRMFAALQMAAEVMLIQLQFLQQIFFTGVVRTLPSGLSATSHF